jgi:hypothetical protein
MSGLRNLDWFKKVKYIVAMEMYVGKCYSGEMSIHEMFGVQIDSREFDSLSVYALRSNKSIHGCTFTKMSISTSSIRKGASTSRPIASPYCGLGGHGVVIKTLKTVGC